MLVSIRTDAQMKSTFTFDHMRINSPGIKMNHNMIPRAPEKIQTEYVDKKGKKIFFRDIIIYVKEEYEIDYNAKEFYWMAKNLNDPGKTFKLSKIASSTILHKKRNKT